MSPKKIKSLDPEALEALSSLTPVDKKTLDDLRTRVLGEATFNVKPTTVALSEKERAALERFGHKLDPEKGGTEAKN